MGRAEAGPVMVALLADPGLPSALAGDLPALLGRPITDDRSWKIQTGRQRLQTDQEGRIGLSEPGCRTRTSPCS